MAPGFHKQSWMLFKLKLTSCIQGEIVTRMNNQPTSNSNLDEIVRADTVEHLENNMVNTNMQENGETTPINDPLPEEEKASCD